MSEKDLDLSEEEEVVIEDLLKRKFFGTRKEILTLAVRRLLADCAGQLNRTSGADAMMALTITGTIGKSDAEERTRAVEQLAKSGL